MAYRQTSETTVFPCVDYHWQRSLLGSHLFSFGQRPHRLTTDSLDSTSPLYIPFSYIYFLCILESQSLSFLLHIHRPYLEIFDNVSRLLLLKHS